MYSKFNVKKDKDLIILNYHIVQNLQGNLCSISASLVAEALGIERTKAHRLIKKLEELKVIKCIKRGTSGSVLSVYEYVYETHNETDNTSNLKGCRTNYETVCEIESATGTVLELNTYGKIYKAVHEGATKVQLKELQDIEGLNKIDTDLFEYLLTIQKDDDSIKSKYKYFTRTIENAIKDKTYTLKQYKEDQLKRFSDTNDNKTKNNVDYIDYSYKDDFEALAEMTRYR